MDYAEPFRENLTQDRFPVEMVRVAALKHVEALRLLDDLVDDKCKAIDDITAFLREIMDKEESDA